MRPNGTEWDRIGPNETEWDRIGPNETEWDQSKIKNKPLKTKKPLKLILKAHSHHAEKYILFDKNHTNR